MAETDDVPASRVSGSETRQRAVSIAVRFTTDEAATLKAAAERAGLTMGAYLRSVALGSPGPRAARRPVRQKVELAQTLGLLGKVGSNVNQLARAYNTDAGLPLPAELAAIRADVMAMRDALMVALGHTP